MPIDGTPLATTTDALQHLIEGEERERLRAGLSALSPADRGLLRRCFVNGERITHIATELGEPPERIRKRKSRAVARLIEIIRCQKNDPSRNGFEPDV